MAGNARPTGYFLILTLISGRLLVGGAHPTFFPGPEPRASGP